MTDTAGCEAYLQAHEARFLDELVELLRIPGISALPGHAGDVADAAAWVAGRCRAAGLQGVEILPTAGHPAVYAEWLGAPDAPTVLIYGHTDVQPVDPLDEWTTPPFEPRVVDDAEGGRIYARGANDDKGNLLPPILAVEALLQTVGRLPLNVKFLIEGEEEIGSPHLGPLLEAEKERLACDLVLSADGAGLGAGDPAPLLMAGLRGLAAMELNVEGPDRDLHSGVYGGTVRNPLQALAQLLGSLHDADGAVGVAGFYDDVVELTRAERDALAEPPFDEETFRRDLGVERLVGEPAHTPRERLWTRPTLEINGLWGGFQGEGIKTVIPRQGHAKISCRLVADQDPVHVLDAIEAHLRSHLPAGARLRVTRPEQGARPYVMPLDHPGLLAARDVAAEVCGQPAFLARSGGTLPMCDLLLRILGTYTVPFAAAGADEAAHGPDEFFRLASFRRMSRAFLRLFERLAQTDLRPS